MPRLVTHFSTLITLIGALAITLALSLGVTLPHSQAMLFSSAWNWQNDGVRVYLLDVNRTLAQPIFISRGDDLPGLPMVWSPDGERVAYVSNTQFPQTWLLNLHDLGFTHLASSITDSVLNAVWSPDGTRLAFVGIHDDQVDIYVADADGGNSHPLTRNGAGYKNLMWSPDSRQIAAESGQSSEDIVLVNVDDGRVVNLTNQPDRDLRPAWSPTGQTLAFISSRGNSGTGGTRFDLYIVDTACLALQIDCATPARRLTDDYPARSASRCWGCRCCRCAWSRKFRRSFAEYRGPPRARS